MEVTIENCVSAKVYKTSTTRRMFITALFIAAYAVVIPFAYITVGEPRSAAILRAQNLEDEKWNAEMSTNVTEILQNDVFEESRENDLRKVKGLSDEEFESLAFQYSTIENQPSKGMFAGWFLTDEQKEIKRKSREYTEKLHKKLKAAAGGDDLVLPPWYLPSAWACLALFATLTAHALFHLLCIWLVNFKAYSLFTPVKGKVSTGDFVLVQPPANRGKSEFVVIVKSSVTGEQKIEFQRQWLISIYFFLLLCQ